MRVRRRSVDRLSREAREDDGDGPEEVKMQKMAGVRVQEQRHF